MAQSEGERGSIAAAGAGAPPQRETFDAIGEAKRLLRAIRSGALATLDGETGDPLTTLVNVATDHDGTPILLLSQLALHTRNLDRDSRASLLLVQAGKGDPLAHARLTVSGRAIRDDGRDDGKVRAALRARFLARHPKAALYADFGDFSFWRLEIVRAHLNGGFARAADLAGAALHTPIEAARDLIDAEADAIAHLNTDHAEALALYATRLCGETEGRWRATGLDPEGLDLAAGDRTARLLFPAPLQGPSELRAALVALATNARKMQT